LITQAILVQEYRSLSLKCPFRFEPGTDFLLEMKWVYIKLIQIVRSNCSSQSTAVTLVLLAYQRFSIEVWLCAFTSQL
jgi:hypothetical protein